MPPTVTPIVNDPRTYVSNRGIVEIHYGVENSTVEWQMDLFDYVREEMREGKYIPKFSLASTIVKCSPVA